MGVDIEKRRERKRRWQQEHRRQMSPQQLEQKRAKDRARREQNVDARRAANREWYANNKDRAKENYRRWAEKNPERARHHKLKSEYGISFEDYQSTLAKQNGVCAICGEPPTERWFAVDHDHETRVVRGLLHRNCNSGLGNVPGQFPFLRKCRCLSTEAR